MNLKLTINVEIFPCKPLFDALKFQCAFHLQVFYGATSISYSSLEQLSMSGISYILVDITSFEGVKSLDAPILQELSLQLCMLKSYLPFVVSVSLN